MNANLSDYDPTYGEFTVRALAELRRELRRARPESGGELHERAHGADLARSRRLNRRPCATRSTTTATSRSTCCCGSCQRAAGARRRNDRDRYRGDTSCAKPSVGAVLARVENAVASPCPVTVSSSSGRKRSSTLFAAHRPGRLQSASPHRSRHGCRGEGAVRPSRIPVKLMLFWRAERTTWPGRTPRSPRSHDVIDSTHRRSATSALNRMIPKVALRDLATVRARELPMSTERPATVPMPLHARVMRAGVPT